MSENKKQCKNCLYFTGYYLIYRDYLKSAGCGVCLKSSHKKRRQSDDCCEKCETDETRKAEQTERIGKTIRDMERRLTQILFILKANK